MAKKKGNKLFTLVVIAAAAAGAYYLYKKSNTEIAVDMEDDDDIEHFGDEVDIDSKPEKRSYVSLDFNAVEQKVKDATVKVADVAGNVAYSLGDMLKKSEERVEEFFDDRKLQHVELENSVDDYVETAEETAENVADDVSKAAEEVTEAVEETVADAVEAVSEAVEEEVEEAGHIIEGTVETFFDEQ